MKVVVLLSGGLDSSTLLYKLVAEGYECYPLTVVYGQKHYCEVLSASKICTSLSEELDSRLIIADFGYLGILLPSALTGVGSIPDGHYESESMKQTVVPNRNMIMLSIAVGYAQGMGAECVFYAAHSGDHHIYPDCRIDFINAMQNVVGLATEGAVRVVTPFAIYNKADIVRVGTQLGVPYEITWTCYKGRERHCGLCGSCVERREAFELAGVTDPTVYEI